MKLAFVAPGDSMHTLPWSAEFGAAGHELLVYAYPPVTQEWPGATVRVVEASGPIGRAMWLRRTLGEDKPDIVVMHYASTDAFALSYMGLRLVISVWGSDILRDLEGRTAKRALVKRALNRAVLLISPARHMTARLEGFGVSASRIVTAQYGADTASIHCERSPGTGSLRVVSTRSLAPVYRVADLLDAATLLDETVVDQVRIAGGGPLGDELRARAEAAGVADRVAFLGTLEHEEVVRELCAGDVYVSTSESDGTSLSLLEAMSASLPCVVSDIPANREWVDESCGVLFPVGDAEGLAKALERLAEDSELRLAMGAEARRRVEDRGDRTRNMLAIRMAVEGLTY